jgi:hypothetical protein
MAGNGMSGFSLQELRFDLGAEICGPWTAIAETTATRQMQRIGHHPGDRIQALFLQTAGAGKRI